MAGKVGLVLPGGGAKGAYQVGVYRALCELGVDRLITAVSATSIGALNAVMLVQGDLEQAEALWTTTVPDLFTKAELDRRLTRYLRPDVIARSPVSVYAACVAGFPLGAVAYFVLNDCTPERMRQILCATSAVPFLFEPVDLDGVQYSDGGLGFRADNTPVQPLHDCGCDTIIVVHLNRGDRVDRRRFPGARLIEINPSRSLGSMLNGNLDFRGENARWRMELGYRDTLEQVELADGTLGTRQHPAGGGLLSSLWARFGQVRA